MNVILIKKPALKKRTTKTEESNNTLLFKHSSTQGYVIDDVTVLFEVSPDTSPEVMTRDR